MRKSKIILSVLLAAALFLPAKDTVQGYQRNLWTSRLAPWTSAGWELDNGVRVDGLEKWHRLRLGYPLKATTIDRNPASGAWQLRLEGDAVVLNLMLWLIICAAVWFYRRLPPRRHLHPDEF